MGDGVSSQGVGDRMTEGKQGQMGIRFREEAGQDLNRDQGVRRLVLVSAVRGRGGWSLCGCLGCQGRKQGTEKAI